MKALNLKGISWIMVWAMMGLVMLAAGCSDDDDAAEVTPTFPELKEINIPANGTGNLSFDANMDWTLSSDASWCRFVDGEFVQTTMSGTAGQQTVRITVSDDDQNYENDDVAQITLRMGGQSQVICKVTRAKKELQALTVTDGEFDDSVVRLNAAGYTDADGNSVYVPLEDAVRSGADAITLHGENSIDDPSMLAGITVTTAEGATLSIGESPRTASEDGYLVAIAILAVAVIALACIAARRRAA